MRSRGFWSILCCFVVSSLLVAQPVSKPPVEKGAEPEGKIIKEVWEAAFLEGSKAGSIHTIFRELTMGERKVIEVTTEMDLTLVRFGQTIRQNFIIANHETEEGKVLAVSMRQDLAKDERLLITGKVEGAQLALRVEIGQRPAQERKLPWDKDVIGLYAQERLFRTRKVKPNDKFDYKKYEPVFSAALTAHVEIKDFEELPLLDGQKKKLLRTETRIDKIMDFTPPVVVIWIDEDGEIVRSQTQLPGLGDLVSYRTTKDLATAKGFGKVVDTGFAQLIKVNMAMPRPHESREAVYRIRLKGVDNAETAFANDDRQQFKRLNGDEFEMVVRGLQQPGKTDKPEKPPEAYLKSNQFVNWENERVKELAQKAIGDEKDPWKRALSIERWVKDNLKDKNFSQAFGTSEVVAKNLEGDCTEHAILAAAMCRAVGVPSRTALGLVYVDRDRSMGYHMWMEVWVNGKWYALDPTLGLGRVGAAHIKIADHHWNDVESLTPLLSVVRLLGKVQIDIVSVRHDAE